MKKSKPRKNPENEGSLRQLTRTLRLRTAALAASRLQLRNETKHRKECEAKIKEGISQYRTLLIESKLMNEQSKNLTHRFLLIQEAERRKISRDLHDQVAQILAGINVQLSILKEASSLDGRDLRKRIGKTQRMVQQSVGVVHRYARKLRPVMLDDLGLIPALRSYIRDILERSELTIRFSSCASVEALGNTSRTVMYRVAQEALTNVICHAKATRASVLIREIPKGFVLTVHDNGKSFSVTQLLASRQNTRLGLIGMRERVEMVGGDFSVVSTPELGTTVRAELPFTHRPKEGGS